MKIRFTLYAASTMLLWGCGSPQEKPHAPIRPVKVFQVESLAHIDKEFAGMSTADEISNLAFSVSGQLIEVNVIEGQNVKQGQVIAKVDPREYTLNLESAKATYLTQKSQLERSERLIAQQAISQQSYEMAKAAFVRAQSSYENAQTVLADTKLRAPFSGAIEKLYVDNYQEVQPGQEIVRLVNPLTSTVKFTMSENALQILKLPNRSFSVTFDNYKGVSFPATLREYVQTSTQATGLTITLSLDSIKAPYTIAPGMSCMINLKVENPGSQGVTAIPITALFSEGDQKRVWVVTNGTVSSRDVTPGELFGSDMVAINRGLQPGDQVITAGVYQIIEGEKVKILK